MITMAENWIQIGKTNYYLKSDRLNWIVARQVECKKSKSFPDGHKLVNESYHPDLKGAFKRVFEESTKLAEAETIQDILKVCEDTYKMLREVLERDFSDKK
jgi:hypothetical protein